MRPYAAPQAAGVCIDCCCKTCPSLLARLSTSAFQASWQRGWKCSVSRAPSSCASTSYSISFADTSTRQKSHGTPHPLPPHRRIGVARRSAATVRRSERGPSVRSAEAGPFIGIPCSLATAVAAEVSATMRPIGGPSKYCHALWRSGHLPRRRTTAHFQTRGGVKLGISLPAATLSAIFRSARVRNTKTYSVRGFRTSHGRDPIAIAGLEILRGFIRSRAPTAGRR